MTAGGEKMWFDEAVIYQIYPLGLCGALKEEEEGSHKVLRIMDWISHIKNTGATCVLFNPLMDSDYHGYDTRDYRKVDRRLGTQEDLAAVCRAIHEAGLKVMFDGVFNHVGRGFWAFQDVREKKWESPYCDWFHLNFDGDTHYNDGFWYEGWEGHLELVKLNLDNPQVRQHQFDVIKEWINLYDVDGLRLDVAYCLSPFYLEELRKYANQVKPEFVLLGETLHGDYNRWMNDNACHSVTNYECYKGLYSSFNSANMHEIAYSLNRQFGYENWCIYRGKHLLSFVDNHDVSRIASLLEDRTNLPVIYGLLFGMPGVPAIYYGSEWGLEGRKQDGDEALRPALEKPEWNTLSDDIATFAKLHVTHPALYEGGYRNLHVWNKQLVFERACDRERVIVAVNSDDMPYFAPFDAQTGEGTNLLTGEKVSLEGGKELPAHSVSYWQV